MSPRESTAIDGDASVAEPNRRASTRIDEHAFVDELLLDLIGIQARWVTRRDRAELRRELLAFVLRLD